MRQYTYYLKQSNLFNLLRIVKTIMEVPEYHNFEVTEVILTRMVKCLGRSSKKRIHLLHLKKTKKESEVQFSDNKGINFSSYSSST